jgi:hypothetical protein
VRDHGKEDNHNSEEEDFQKERKEGGAAGHRAHSSLF